MKKAMQWKAALAGACLMICSCAALAQQDGPPGPPQDGPPPGDSRPADRGPNADRELKTLTRLLSLTTDQQTGVKALLEQQVAQIKALRNQARSETSTASNTDPRQERMEQVDRIREETNTKITALLDESQKKTFVDWEQKRKAEMEKRRSEREDSPPPPPPGGPVEK